ncbi:MAG: transglycosylase SLT domain-containing protein [bacterium]
MKRLNKGNNGQLSNILKNRNINTTKNIALALTILFCIVTGAIFIFISLYVPEVVRADNQIIVKTANTDTLGQELFAKMNNDTPLTFKPKDNADCMLEIAKYDWQQNIAIAVMKAESGGNTKAKNDNPATGDYSIGCFQINIYGANAKNRPSETELYDAKINVAFAYRLYSSSGWQNQWGAYRDKSYLRYL